MKQPRLLKPYSSKISTTLAPINPLDPVIKIRSSGETIYSKVITRIEENYLSELSPFSAEKLWLFEQQRSVRKKAA